MTRKLAEGRFTGDFFAPRPGSVVNDPVSWFFSSENFRIREKRSPRVLSDTTVKNKSLEDSTMMMMKEDELSRFIGSYPAEKRKGGERVRQLFDAALMKVPFVVLLSALAQHKRSVQWQEPRYIPSIEKWLAEERWVQVLPEPKIPSARLTPFERARRAGLK